MKFAHYVISIIIIISYSFIHLLFYLFIYLFIHLFIYSFIIFYKSEVAFLLKGFSNALSMPFRLTKQPYKSISPSGPSNGHCNGHW